MTTRLLPVMLLALLLPHCVGTDVGNPQDNHPDGETRVVLEFAAFEETDPRALTLNSGIVLDEAWMVFNRVRLREASRCEDDGEVDLREPIVVDLLRPEVAFGSREFTRPAGEFCRLDLEFDDLDADELPNGAPAELAERSIFIAGRRADGQAFQLRADFGDRFRLDADDAPFRLEQGVAHLQVAFAANTWLDADALNALDADDGPIVIDDDQHGELLDAFRQAVKRSARLLRDGDPDDRLAVGRAD